MTTYQWFAEMLTANILSWQMGWFSTITVSLQSVFTFFYGHFYWRRISEYLLSPSITRLSHTYLETDHQHWIHSILLQEIVHSDQTQTKPKLPTSKVFIEGIWSQSLMSFKLQLKWPRLIRLGWPTGACPERIRTSVIPSMCTCQSSGHFLSAGIQVACSLDANHTVPQPVFHGI